MENVRSDVRPKPVSRHPKQSRKSFWLSQASDPILAMASAPYDAPVNPLRFTNTGKT